VNERDEPCGPGEIGRVLITVLHNFAMPLIRYELGDYAERGAACECGRGLAESERIGGRARNMMRLADGRRLWPTFASKGTRAIAPVVQMQLVQVSLERVEARMVVERPLTPEEKRALAEVIASRWGTNLPIEVAIVEVDRIERGAGDKFEDFLCEVRP